MASKSLASSLAALRISSSSASAPATRSFSSTSISSYKTVRKPFNPYAEAASKKRRDANIALQERLQAEREASLVDPVRGRHTSFHELVNSVPLPPPSLDAVLSRRTSQIPDDAPLNHFLDPKELPEFLNEAHELNKPAPSNDPFAAREASKAAEEKHRLAVEAIRRIVALGNGSSGDRTRANKQLCIKMFGRHNTDHQLPVDPGAKSPLETNGQKRAGPDTGSSEVQAAILTVKINALLKAMESTNSLNKDKHNKRNLRLMVHRRQKLLKYLKRKEKGGIRYRNIMDALGLDEAAVHNELFI